MEYIPLKEVCKINMGQSPDSSSYNYNKDGIPFFQGNADFGEKYPITRIWCSNPTKIAQKKDILISIRAPIGAVNYAKEESCIGRGLAAITPDGNKVSLEFIYWLLKGKKEELNNKGTGSTFKAIGRKVLEELMVPNIELSRQYKYAEILERNFEIIQKYKQELELLDNLIKARFVEMFGKLKDVIRLGDCCEVHARIGWQALTRDEHMQSGDYLLVTGTDFVAGKVNYDTCAYVSKERYEMDPHIILRDNDVLITKDGSIGKVAVVYDLPKPATLNSGVFVVRPDDKFNKEYISYVFRGPLFERFVELSKTGATIKHLNQKYLVDFCIPLPSMEEQKTFAIFSKQIDKSKVVVQKYYKICYNNIIFTNKTLSHK